MKPKSRETKQASGGPAELRISGDDTHIPQFAEVWVDPANPALGHTIILSLAKAKLELLGGGDLFAGEIILRINTEVTPATLAIFVRLFDPFKGFFTTGVRGTYEVFETYAELNVSLILFADIQPN